MKQLTPELRSLLSEVGAVVVDKGEFGRLGIEKVGDVAEVFGHRLRIVGTVTGLRSLAGPYVFCSLETAKILLHPPADQTTFLLAKCANAAAAQKIVDDMKPYDRKLNVFTAEQFSFNSRWHWLTKTKAGIALGFAALLGLLVGAVVTSQTLYAATAAAIKEYAVLRAMGIPRWRMYMAVISQSFWVGIAGIAVSVPAILAVASIGSDLGAKVILPWWLWVGAVSITLCMAMISGLFAAPPSAFDRTGNPVALSWESGRRQFGQHRRGRHDRQSPAVTQVTSGRFEEFGQTLLSRPATMSPPDDSRCEVGT